MACVEDVVAYTDTTMTMRSPIVYFHYFENLEWTIKEQIRTIKWKKVLGCFYLSKSNILKYEIEGLLKFKIVRSLIMGT